MMRRIVNTMNRCNSTKSQTEGRTYIKNNISKRVMALLSGVLAIPGYAVQTDDDDYMVLEVTKKATLRNDYYAKSSILTTLEENTILFFR